IPLQNDFPERSRKNDYHRSLRDFESPHTSAYEKNFTNGYTNNSPKKAYSTNYLEDEDMEQPMVIDQAKKAPRAKRRGRYGSFSTLNDDEYASDMDDFMDPDFYMTYSSANTPQPDRSARFKTAPPQNSGSKSVELPRKAFNAISQK
uniref:Uncharacterized protein n=1 Tax=Acrobeloides nanus TaxID=290746 RepID=A0A914DCV1_9BILA